MKRHFIASGLLLLVAVVLVLSLVGCPAGSSDKEKAEAQEAAQAGSKEAPMYTGAPITMKLAWAETADPKSHPASASFTVFKAYVENLTGGKLEVELYPAGQLGDAKSMIEQVEQGIIQSCASVPSGLIAGTYYDVFNIFDMPYLFRSPMIAWEVLKPDSPFFKELADAMAEKTGIRPLGFFTEGQRHFTNNVREIRTPADLKGLKIRTMEVPAHMEMVKSMGATPTPISWLELYSALQTGVVDGQENPVLNIQYLKAQEVQKYLTLDGHIFLINVWCVNEEWYSGLPESIKIAVQEAVAMSTVVSRGISELTNTIGVVELAEAGMQVYAPSASELAQFREVTQAAVIPWVKENVSDSAWIDKLQEAVSQAESKY